VHVWGYAPKNLGGTAEVKINNLVTPLSDSGNLISVSVVF
jgi:hypothetical protein